MINAISAAISAADITKPLGVFSSETEWLNVFFCLLFEKCIIKQLLNSVFAWYHELSKPRVCVICRSRRLRQITQTRGFDNSWYHAQPHPIIVYYLVYFQPTQHRRFFRNLPLHFIFNYSTIVWWRCLKCFSPLRCTNSKTTREITLKFFGSIS